jgi:hypothetical protein
VSGSVLLRTYREVLERYVLHPESKSLDSGGRSGVRDGLLIRRDVWVGTTAYIGKESNLIEEASMGLWHQLKEVVTQFGHADDAWSQVMLVLREVPARTLAEETGLSRRSIQRFRNGHARPHRRNADALTRAAGRWSRANLRRKV